MILRPEIIDFYSPPTDPCFLRSQLCQDWVTWGQCHPWKQQQGSFSSNSITLGMSFMPRLCYRWCNKSAFYFFNQAIWDLSRMLGGKKRLHGPLEINSTGPGDREYSFPSSVLCDLQPCGLAEITLNLLGLILLICKMYRLNTEVSSSFQYDYPMKYKAMRLVSVVWIK